MPVIEVVTKNVASEHKGPSAPHVGNQDFFSDDLLNAQNQVVGTHSGFCTLVRVTPGNAPDLQECQATFTLPQGQVTARGLYSTPMAVGQSSKVAITGGTDAYANARGQVTWTQLAAGGRVVLDIIVL
jgi:hypothetical protein